ncbi:uncharacterized protein EI90DRAFT_1826786 [Cantharellus anzutake]|uniref:uncharacterized protein n=1 Tax=Cantharellus anzutake TaxID=1750568 RepID=UPI001907F05B|nr:uncharacterized protein EI90DRAFT_1826786 [Cantharellus anzutake]KAF8327185.1 hypothetical protein EI90DRAFT_1826786 [Cantharellus anzutake]
MVPTVISPPGAPENAAPPSLAPRFRWAFRVRWKKKNKSAHLPTGEQDSLRIGSDEPVAEPSKSPFSSASPDTTSPSLPGPSKSSFQMPPHPPSHQDFTSPLTSPAPVISRMLLR